MEPRIEQANRKRLIGMKLVMSLAADKTADLWRSFMPRRNEIANNLTSDLICVKMYQPDYFSRFDPTREFEKWAVMEVAEFSKVPHGMQTLILDGGLYAVFDYKGLNTDDRIFRYIFTAWLPNSQYVPDNRPHFDVLGAKYKNNDPTSEEELWIPIKPK